MVPERRGDGGAGAVHLRPEVRHREPPVDRRAAAVHQRAEHRGDDGVEVEQRQRRPHHVVGGAPPADADLAGEGLVVVVAEHAALRRAGRAAGVDEGGQVGRADVDRRRVVAAGRAGRPRRGTLDAGARSPAPSPITTTWARSGTAVDDPGGPVGQVGLDHEHPRAGVGELVAQVLALVGGVDRHGDGAGDARSPTRPAWPRPSSRSSGGDPVAGADAERRRGRWRGGRRGRRPRRR